MTDSKCVVDKELYKYHGLPERLEFSLEVIMAELNLSYFGPNTKRKNLLEKIIVLGKAERSRGRR